MRYGHGFIVQDIAFERGAPSENKFTFAQGIEHAKFFADGTSAQLVTLEAFALDDALEVEGHLTDS